MKGFRDWRTEEREREREERNEWVVPVRLSGATRENTTA
jgi:hypothetical protein